MIDKNDYPHILKIIIRGKKLVLVIFETLLNLNLLLHDR